MPDVMSNRRNSPRFALILAAISTEIGSNTRLIASTSDVSRTGCYIDTLNPIPQGKVVNAELTRGEEVFESRGQVMYVSPGFGMGVKFDEPLDPSQIAVLNRWLEDSANLRL